MLAQLTPLWLPEKAGRANMEKPLCTVNPKAAQRPSSTGLRDEKRFRRVTVGMEMHRSSGGNTCRHHSAFSKGEVTLPTRSHREGQVRPKEGLLSPSSQVVGRAGGQVYTESFFSIMVGVVGLVL